MTQSVKKKGYIDVKIPAKSRNGPIKKWKAWKRRWVVIHGLHDITSGTPIITIDIYPHEQMENQQFERTTIYLNNIKSISRTLSKTHPYAFQVITAECTLFLSGKSETDSQAWILAFRRILWPPVSKMSLEDTIGGVYDAVVIECLSPVTATLKGVIAHLIILPSVVLIGGFETGGILYDWPLKMISNVRLVNVSNVADKGKIVAIETSSEATLSGKFHFFSEKGEELVDALSSCLKECKIDISETKSERQRRISTYHLRTMSSGRSSISQNPHNERYVQLRKCSEDWTSTSSTMSPPSNEPNSTSQSLLNLHPDPDTASFHPKMEKLIEDDKERHCTDARLPSPVRVPSNSDSVILRKPKTNQICASRLSSSMSNLSDVTKKLSDNKCYKESDRGIPSATVRSTGSLDVTEDVAVTPKGVVAETVTLRRRQRKTSPKQSQAKQPCTRMSRDSGVGACNADEPSSRDSSAGRGLPSSSCAQTENGLDELPRPASFGDYENFGDDVEEQPWRCCSSSSSEESTIYSEIDFDNFHVTAKDDTFAKYDPIYEDLELFRKDIHKLLGIPIKAGEKLSNKEDTKVSQEVPPPLPPRKYTNNTSQPVDLRRKDVYKFLGVEGNIEARVGQGTRFSSVTIPSSPATINRRRKNICSFLGIPNMPDTCNQQVATAEGNQATYDTLIGIVPRKYNPAIPQPHDKSLTYSGSLKSYVRPRTLQRPPALPSPLPIQKRLKKRSGSFLKLLSSSKNKDLNLDDCNSATYVRYDWSVPDHLDDFRSTLRKKDSGLGAAEGPLSESKQEVITEMKSEVPIFQCEETPPSPAKPLESKERNTDDDALLAADRLSKHLNRLSDDILRVRAARSCSRELGVFNNREPRSKSADTKADKSLLKPQEDETPSYENLEVVRETLRREAANLAMQNFPSSNTNNELKTHIEGIVERRGISRPRTDSLYTDMSGPRIHVSRCEDPLEFVPDGNYSRFNLDIDSDYAMIDFELHRAEQQELDEISLLGSPDEVFPLTSIESMVSEQAAAFTNDDFRSSPVSLESVFTCLGELRSLCDLNSTGKSCRKSVLYCSDTDLKIRENLVFSFGSSDEFNSQVSTICDLDEGET